MKKIDSLQAFRAVAFLFVFLSHTEMLSTGGVGVSMFLVLGGFLAAFSNAKKQHTEPVTFRSSVYYAANKISKLYPLHMLTLVLMAAYTMLLLWKNHFPVAETKDAVLAFPLNALLLQAWIPNEEFYFTFNKVSWYLSVCLFIYFVFPFFFRKLRKQTTRKLLYAGAWIIGVQIIIAGFANMALPIESRARFVKWIVYICPLFRSGDFFLGVILGLVCINSNVKNEKERKASLKASLIEILYVIVLVILCVFRERNWTPMWLGYGIVWIPMSLIGVYLFYKQKGGVTRLISNELLIRIGNLSAYAFLIHQMTIHLVKFLITDVYLLSFVSLILTIIFSYGYGRLESRVFQYKNNRTQTAQEKSR